MLELRRYSDFSLFKRDVLPFLEQHEGENNLPLGVIMNMKPEQKPLYMGTVNKDGKLALVLLQTHPSQLILSKSLPFADEEIEEIAKKLYESYPNIPGMIGEKWLATALAEKIAKLQQRRVHVQMKQRIYVLKQVKKPASKRGVLRPAQMSDMEMLRQWFVRFCEDVRLPASAEEAAQAVQGAIANQQIYVWTIDGEPVSMARWARPTKTNVTIGWVYTPPEKRKNGYASDCVAALTQHVLDLGYKTASLYTDLDNPTSNKIYMEIGYEPVMDSMLLLFQKEETQ
jgi:predicted GNAT family acetyltransferase